MNCSNCISRMRRELGELEGVQVVEGSTRDKVISVTWELPASWSKIRGTLSRMGYPPLE